jgi:beta-galactosidase
MLLALSAAAQAQFTQVITLSDGWQFSRDKQSWDSVCVPHDWAIAGPFDKKWDLQTVAIEQNGETTPTEKSGRSGALPWIGEGHYRRTIQIPEGYQRGVLVFDGAMAEPTVSLNGEKAGYWPYGYNNFMVDITPFLKTGDNLLEVDLKNVEESSRWYPGAGIYRPVKLYLLGEKWVDPSMTFIRTKSLQEGKALLDVTVGTSSCVRDWPSTSNCAMPTAGRWATAIPPTSTGWATANWPSPSTSPACGRPRRLTSIPPISASPAMVNCSTRRHRSSASAR